jgi:hypothetical protein
LIVVQAVAGSNSVAHLEESPANDEQERRARQRRCRGDAAFPAAA